MGAEGTVANHVERLLRKLRLRGPTQVVVRAIEHGLYRSCQDDDQKEPEGSERRQLRPAR